MGEFSNPVATHPRTNEVEVPPPGDNTQNQMNDKGLYFSALVFREEINYTKDLLS